MQNKHGDERNLLPIFFFSVFYCFFLASASCRQKLIKAKAYSEKGATATYGATVIDLAFMLERTGASGSHARVEEYSDKRRRNIVKPSIADN